MKLVEKDFGGFKMILDLDLKGISRPLYGAGKREEVFMSIIEKTLKEGMACIDLGANIGYTTLFMLEKIGDDGFIYAVEPDSRNFDLLKTNIIKNNFENKCELIQAVISDKNDLMDFWIAESSNISSVQKTPRSIEKISIKAYTLGGLLEGKRFPNFIKMDVEGHEVKILEGGLDYFKNNEGDINILMEVHPSYYNEENSLAQVLQKYFDIGFTTKYVVSTPVSRPKLFAEAGYFPVINTKTDRVNRGLYDGISNKDVINFACYEHEEKCPVKRKISKKIVRSIMIGRTM